MTVHRGWMIFRNIIFWIPIDNMDGIWYYEEEKGKGK